MNKKQSIYHFLNKIKITFLKNLHNPYKNYQTKLLLNQFNQNYLKTLNL